ncbi:energy-coupled thiamine transporter ThiT [Anaerococcus sp.]|uniref:energy-coupled thiamine transporter ThiT n=1 Tax=Anaerococcus sp. TaxID=1872515 RepID=UPI00280C1A81|nr:energy-coupled thiamine transporter ThiT [Anaerococcus sp.]MDU3176455.1 energy-coupled thiamine transporter ThiT [Anaerococcus sp.]
MQNNKTKSSWTTKMLVEGALAIALSFVLARITFFKMPQGGEITPGQMIPLIIFSIRYGAGKGFLIGALYGIVDMMFGGYIIHPIQAILDYPLPYGLIGLSGLFSEEFKRTHQFAPILKGTLIAILARFVTHVVSGVVFFSSYASEGQGALAYSLVYNGSYLAVEYAIALVILFLLKNFLTNDLPNM